MKVFDTIIIGGGAAGLVCALTAARRGLSVCVLEKNDRCGKKLSQTGNGRCNFTNSAMAYEYYHSDSPEAVKEVLDRFGWQDTVSFFEGIGIVPVFREGYCYPASGEARSFADLLTAAVIDAGAQLHMSCTVTGIETRGDAYFLTSQQTPVEPAKKKGPSGKKAAAKAARERETVDGETAAEEMFSCRNLVLAAGGAAAPKTGSAGESFLFLEKLGLPVEKPLPALVSLHLGKPYDPELFGLRLPAKTAVFADSVLLSEDTGEIQFTKEGLSGIPVMNVSSPAVRCLAAGKEVELSINLFPEGLTGDSVYSIVKKSGAGRPVSQALTGLLPYKAAPFFLEQAGLKKSISVGGFHLSDAEEIAKTLTGLHFPVTGYADFDRAQVTSGGLLLSAIHPESCETVNHPGLFVIGEDLNCDGRCGGYNLQWAFATGHLAGSALKGTIC